VGAREVGLRGIGVTWGFGSASELEEAGAVMTVKSPSELLSTFKELG
jgi:phosphoglycolate phosphatase